MIKSHILYSPVTLVVSLILTGLICLGLLKNLWFFSRQLGSSSQLDQEVAQLKTEVESLQAQLLPDQHAFLQEKIIREELLLQQPGEIVVQVPTSQADQQIPESDADADLSNQHPLPVYRQWLQVLF